MKPKVTVLMPVFNAALYLRKAIESILAQTFTDFEFIIINDGSTDNSQQIIESFKDARIKLVVNEHNLGIIETRNKGLRLAQGIYIANMDADDISLPNRFEEQVKFLDQHPDVAVLATKLLLIDEKDTEIGIWHEDFHYTSQAQIKATLPIINCVGQPTVMMRSEIIKSIGYNKSYIHNEDWGLWLDVISKGFVIAKLNDFFLKYRIHSESTTITANAKGIEKKIIRFKFSYLKNNFLKFNKINNTVFVSLTKEIARHLAPTAYKITTKLYKVNVVKLLSQYLIAKNKISKINYPVHNIFFFPFYHTGGAEKVHASILETVADKKPIVFITGKSEGNALLQAFQKNATVIEVNLPINIGPFNRWLTKKIKSICEKNENAILFGCNSEYFYELIPLITSEVKCIDLIHAFVHKYEAGPEKWSLPVISRLDKRVVINEKTKKDFEKLYLLNKIDATYLSRIICIPNFVEHKQYIEKEKNGKLKVLYVGRGTPEKRVHLIAQIAYELTKNNVNVEFHFAGNVKDAIPEKYLSYCILHGEIVDEKIMEKIYSDSQILIMTSSREGFPMVIMEAMMQSVVPISTNVGGISEHLINKVNGILINDIEENEIIKSFVKEIAYYSLHIDELAKLTEQANKYANEKFNKENFFCSYLSIFEK